VIAAVEASGLVGDLLGWAGALNLHRPAVLTAVTAVLSNLVSNVPAVRLFKSLIPAFGEPARGWLILAMASTRAGNLTIVGSVANLIVVERARSEGIDIGFVEYAKVGVLVTLLTLLLGRLILGLTRGLTRRRHEGTILAGTRRRRSWGREPVSSSSTGCARPAASFGSATSASTTSRPTRSSPAPRGRWRACSTASTSMPTSA
jgi:di/tricarboxylate transporter